MGNRSLSAIGRALVPKGTLVLVGGRLSAKLGAKLLNRFVEQRLVSFIAKVNKDRLVALKELVEAGQVVPAIDRTFPLNEAPETIRYVETRHARGKVVISV